MEEDKTHPAADHQEEALASRDATGGGMEVVTGEQDLLQVLAGNEADRSGLDSATAIAIASDAAIALAMHMEELMEMDESALRTNLPSRSVPQDVPARAEGPYSRPRSIDLSGSGAGASGAAQDPYMFRPISRLVLSGSGAGAGGAGQVPYLGPRSTISLSGSRAGASGAAQGPYFRPRLIALSGSAAGASGAAQIRRTVPAEILQSRPSTSTAWPPQGQSWRGTSYTIALDVVSSNSRRTLLAHEDSSVVLAGMEEEHDNGWYESVIREAQRYEQMEETELDGSSPSAVEEGDQLSQSDSGVDNGSPNRRPDSSTAEAAGGFSMQEFFKRWGIRPSELDPEDEPGTSAKRPRVPPLADEDIPKFYCGICMETLDVFDLFHGLRCQHRFCTACMSAYLDSRIREASVPIACPDPACNAGEGSGLLHPEDCKKAIDFAAFTDWGMRLTERALPPNRRTYCPNRHCGIMLETSGEEKPAMAPCPACHHLLCAKCGQEWILDDSAKHDCANGPEEGLLKKLADQRRWKQCPKCKMMVERIDGCRVMHCRCRFVFCYQCGRAMSRAYVQGGGEACCMQLRGPTA